MTGISRRTPRSRPVLPGLHTGGVETVKNARPRLDASSVAVCAHVGIGADDSVARAARDRLGNALANYRRHWSADAEPQVFEDRLLPGDEAKNPA